MALKIVFALFLAASLPAAAAERGFELGTRYWLSSGENRFAHNAQSADPTLGNPTSILTYEELDARALELHWRSNFSSDGWFFKGNFGLGEVRDGAFDDEDYDAAQAKTDDTTSAVRGERFSYLTLDVGKDLWASAGGSTLGLFVGFQQWSEQVDAFGLMTTVGGSPNLPESTRVITNDVLWRSLRIGVAGSAAVPAGSACSPTSPSCRTRSSATTTATTCAPTWGRCRTSSPRDAAAACSSTWSCAMP